MKRFSPRPSPALALLVLVLLLAGCSSEQPPAETAATQPAGDTAGRATPTNEPLAEQPTTTQETAGSTDVATMPPTEVAETEAPAVVSTAAPTETAVATQFNGQNPDGTFFRGAVDALVTMIDYSDFL